MDGPTAVVTGADGDLGEAVARRFAAAGARVVASGRDRDELDELVADVEASVETAGEVDDGEDSEIVGVRADVRDEYDVERLMELAARESDGGVDAVVACAEVDHGDPGGTPLADDSYAAFDDTLRTNARGVFATIREAVPHLSDDARVLVPAGSAARDPDLDRDSSSTRDSRPNRGSYAVSKAAAAALAREFAAELDAAVGIVDSGNPEDEATESANGTNGANGADDPDLETAADLAVWAATEAPSEQVDGEVVDFAAFESATA